MRWSRRTSGASSSPRPAPPTATRSGCRSRRTIRSGRSIPMARRSWRSSGCCTGSAPATGSAGGTALFQRRRGRPRRRDRRESRARDAPHPAGDRRRSRRAALRVFGTDYPTPDGTAVRDYIHVSDLAAAHVLSLGRLLEAGGSHALNLGTGTGHSVRSVIEAVARRTNRPVPAEMAPRRPGDPPALVADPSEARKLLGWQPACSDMTTIVDTAWRWHSAAPNA